MPNLQPLRSLRGTGILRNDNFWDTFNFPVELSTRWGFGEVRVAYGSHPRGCDCLRLCREVQRAYVEYREQLPDEQTIPLQSEGESMPEETLVGDDPVVVKRASEVNPVNPESILLSAKLSRGAKGLALYLKSPILESFFRLLSEDRMIAVTSQGDRQRVERWKIGHVVQYLNEGRDTNKAGFPQGGNYYQFIIEGAVNLQLLTTKGLGEGVVLHCDIPMSKQAMSDMLDTLKLAAKDIYLSFCVPVEGSIEISVKEHHSATGASVIE